MAVKTTSDPVKEYQMLREKTISLSEGIKSKLERQLADAAETAKVLMEIGVNVAGEPQFAHHLDVFAEVAPAGRTRKASGDRQPRTDFIIRDWLAKEGEKTMDDIIKQFSAVGADKIKSVIAKRSSGSRPVFKQNGNKVAAVTK